MHRTVTTPSLPTLIPKDVCATASGANDVPGAIAVKISHPDLQTKAWPVLSDREDRCRQAPGVSRDSPRRAQQGGQQAGFKKGHHGKSWPEHADCNALRDSIHQPDRSLFPSYNLSSLRMLFPMTFSCAFLGNSRRRMDSTATRASRCGPHEANRILSFGISFTAISR